MARRVRTCPRGPITPGIDVSTYQGVIDWSKVAASGVKFAYIRAGDGMGTDAQFARNWAGAKAAGVLRGAYVYFRARHGGVEQAQHLLAQLGKDTGELPPAIDIETLDGQTAAEVVAQMQAWLGAIGNAIGRNPVVYSGAFWQGNIASSALSAYALWTPDYSDPHCPGVPLGWTDWKIWQHTSSGSVPGITGRVDLNYFNGSEKELRRFAGQSSVLWRLGLAILLLGGSYWAWRRYSGGRKRLR